MQPKMKRNKRCESCFKTLTQRWHFGVGTGSTVNFLIDLLPELQLEAAVASSQATADRLKN